MSYRDQDSDILISELEGEPVIIVTSSEDSVMLSSMLEKASYDFENKSSNIETTYLNEKQGVTSNITIDLIDSLAVNAHSDVAKILQIVNICRFFVTKGDLLGKVYETIETNVNPDIRLNFPEIVDEDENKTREAEAIINDFNAKIDIEQLVIETVPLAYLEGNRILYLREKNGNFEVDSYPLGVALVSDKKVGQKPYVMIDMKELKSRLRKTYRKNKKNRPLFYENMEDEIKKAYPKEVYKAYKNKESYAILEIENTGLVRVNNLGRKYGLSPIFRALKPTIRLEDVEVSDDKSTAVRGKKLLWQKTAKELIVNSTKNNVDVTWHQAQARAHMDLLSAIKTKGLSLYTSVPWVEDVGYIEPQIEQTNSKNKNQYKTDIMTSVGISFLSPDNMSVATAQISITELMKVIDKISKQLEKVLHGWYKKVLVANGIEAKYAPKVKFLDSEQMETSIKVQLIELLYSKLNCSYSTAYAMLGMNAKDEYRKRMSEKEKGYEDVFTPHQTSYTTNNDTKSSGSGSGSGSGTNNNKTKVTDKQDYDNTRSGDG